MFVLFQKLDYRDKENSGKKKILGIIFAYLLSNTILSYNFFISFDERSFIILSFTSSLFLLSLIVLTDFENLFLGLRLSEVLKTLPVKSSNFFKAKFLSTFIYLLIFIVSASLPQVIFFYNINFSIERTFFFILTDIIFCYFAIGMLVLIYTFALKYFKAKAILVLNILQILFFAFVFYSSTLSSRIASLPTEFLIKENILNYSLVKYLPQTLYSNSVYSIPYFILCLFITITVFGMLFVLMSKDYYALQEKVKSLQIKKTSPVKKFSAGFFENTIQKYVLRNNIEIASYNLVKYQLSNSKFLRIKYLPIVIMPLLFVIIGIISNTQSLLFFSGGTTVGFYFNSGIPLISPSITFTLVMCSRLLISNTKILDENSNDTLWIYDSLPIKNKKTIIKGANKFIYVTFILPIIISILILLSFKVDFQTILLNILFVTAAIYLVNSTALLFDKTYPFTLESSKFSSASKFIEIFLAIVTGLIIFLIQIFVFQNIIFVIISVVVFIAASSLLNRN